MAPDERRFVIVPREVLTSDAYSVVRADRATLGAWLLLYLEADVLWPVAPSIPRWVTDAQLEALALTGLLTLDGDDRYRLAIVDASREAAKAKASHAAKSRWDELNDARGNAPSNAPSNAQGDARPMLDPMPTQTQTETETYTDSVVRESHSARGAEPALPRRTKVRGFTSPLEGRST
jgi:hypothetical protein